MQNSRGFKHILKNLHDQATTTSYNNLIEALAQEVVAAADTHALPTLGRVPALSAVASAFRTDGAGGATPSSTVTGPKHVRFVYIAADPNSFGNARGPDPYLTAGGADWKPYFPADVTRIHRFAQQIASSDELDFTSEELPFTPNLVKDIIESGHKRQIVVLIVDGWSLQWNPEYQSTLRELDQRLDVHWCVLVPSNEHDVDARNLRAQIDHTLQTTFDRHINLAPNPLFYRDNIASAGDFKKQLGDVLTRLKEEIRKRAEVTVPVPVGPSKPVVSNTAPGDR